MKKLFLILITVFLLIDKDCLCQSSGKSYELSDLNWLAGQWERQGMKPGRTGHERWQPASGNAMHGWGVSFHGQDTSFVEKLQIIKKDKDIYYVADVPENKTPVLFLMTDISADGFICENPDHDFPKKISYRREGDLLTATISGDGKEMSFRFIREW
ncbi:hypothetical protein C900_02035 [Fulvivirga imtechensis AK7]|uniref:DUF6265 domain-containing protein n=1 Tax=Fulvivirga imtechensis AK7 TaxID=1237149 RepID=L8JX23_9BACT|nr:DUF6265 family protein [Fulvivirga imtechensis]ELR73631.1 hypothetical protein C900_02035 [Fulvivirga imtechensis AK7]